MARASTANEGKVHLGYVYAANGEFQTASHLIDDALLFRVILMRCMTPAEFKACLYDTFDYIIPHNSGLSTDEIRTHFARVEQYVRQRKKRLGLDYLGQSETPSFSAGEPPAPNSLGCFKTQERGVWPVGLARAVRACVDSHPRITVVRNTRVDRIEPFGEKWRVVFSGPARKPDGPFDIVVNAAWADRRNIDCKSGYPDNEDWFTRLKFGVLLQDASTAFGGVLPRNVTATSGSFGDSVYFPQNDTLYTCWYPVGMCYSTAKLFKDCGLPELGDNERFIHGTWAGYATIDPHYSRLDKKRFAGNARLMGDYIMAKGKSDIDDASSELHKRVGLGPRQLDKGYWTVETGKFTSAPRCAAECVERALAAA